MEEEFDPERTILTLEFREKVTKMKSDEDKSVEDKSVKDKSVEDKSDEDKNAMKTKMR